MKMTLNKEKNLAALYIDGNLNAQEMDDLISHMGELRSTMQPSVAQRRPSPRDPAAMTTPTTVEDSPAMMAAKLRDGRIRFWARSAGFGWLGFNVIEQDALVIRDYLTINLPAVGSDLFGESDNQTH